MITSGRTISMRLLWRSRTNCCGCRKSKDAQCSYGKTN